MENQIHISWLILVYDRNAEERFPLKRKWYVFSYERATEEEIKKVLQLCCSSEEDSLPIPELKEGESHVSFSVGANNFTDFEILKYRHLFDYVSDYGSKNPLEENYTALISVSLPPESYFEDEEEKQITYLEIHDEEGKRLHGDNCIAIVPGVPQSILRFNAPEPVRAEGWRSENIEIIVHFINLFYYLQKSRWFNTPCRVSPSGKEGFCSRLPVNEDCMAIILPFRQMYSQNASDDLFNKVCNIHNRHCPQNHPAFMWIKNYKYDFNQILDDPPNVPLQKIKLSTRRYLDAFAYGAKLIHVKSGEDAPVIDLKYLLSNFQKELVILQYHMILHQLLRPICMCIDLLKKNFSVWIKSQGWISESQITGPGFFDCP